ncbi:hypothetical protein QBE53_15545 [Vallitaleaceae bacterium 9-2]
MIGSKIHGHCNAIWLTFIVSNTNYKVLSPHQIVPKLHDEEEHYIAFESTMYRVLRDVDMIHHRGRTKSPERRKASMHKATGPKQV